LYACIAALFSAAHFFASTLANSLSSARSSVAERLIFSARVFASKSLLTLRFVAFFGAFLSNRRCIPASCFRQNINAHHYAHNNASNKVVKPFACGSLGRSVLRTALAWAWRHCCPSNRSMLSAAYLGVETKKRTNWASWHVMRRGSLQELMGLGGWRSYEMVLR
jgi:hypothetical protein